MTTPTKITLPYRSTLTWIKNNSPFSYGIITSVLLMALCCTQLLLANTSANTQLLIAENRYGEQITDMIAAKLRQATASDDLISMQAELNELTQNPAITTAIIYDINNRVKVQSGTPIDRLGKKNRYLNFSASITQDESIIGQLSIITQQANSKIHINYLSSIVFLLALALLLFCLYKNNIHLEKTDSAIGQSPQKEVFVEHTENSETCINLLLQFKNIDTIFKQLSKEIREEKYRKINTSINKVLKIYNGQIKAIDAQSLFITISDNDKQQAVLNTACCAGLLQKIAREENWFIKTNTIIYEIDDNATNIDLLTTLQHLKNYAENRVCIDKNLATIISTRTDTQELNKKSGNFVEVVSFSEQYQNLLDNQSKHLRI